MPTCGRTPPSAPHHLPGTEYPPSEDGVLVSTLVHKSSMDHSGGQFVYAEVGAVVRHCYDGRVGDEFAAPAKCGGGQVR